MKPNDYAYPVSPELLEKERLGHFKNAGEPNPLGFTKKEFVALEIYKALTIKHGGGIEHSRTANALADDFIRNIR